MAVLRIKDLWAGYGQGTVVRGADFEVQTGLVLGLSGQNGCGKTTLFRAILGLIPLRSGQVLADSQALEKARWDHIGYLPQGHFLPGVLTPRTLAGLYPPSPQAREWVESHELYRRLAKVKIKSLSEGERRFLEIILVLSMEKDFYLLDEPFTRLDPLVAEASREVILEKAKTSGILVTDHNVQDLKKASHRRLIMQAGTIIPYNHSLGERNPRTPR